MQALRLRTGLKPTLSPALISLPTHGKVRKARAAPSGDCAPGLDQRSSLLSSSNRESRSNSLSFNC